MIYRLIIAIIAIIVAVIAYILAIKADKKASSARLLISKILAKRVSHKLEIIRKNNELPINFQ